MSEEFRTPKECLVTCRVAPADRWNIGGAVKKAPRNDEFGLKRIYIGGTRVRVLWAYGQSKYGHCWS